MIEAIRITLPYLALFSHFLFVVLFATVVFRHSFGRSTVSLIGKRALVLGFLISLAALAGSLFYSEIVGYEACVLCWWQRVFLYPQLVLFAIALWKNERSVFAYSVVLSVFAGVIAAYQSYVYMGGASLLPCTAAEGGCSKIYVKEFGYITIPMMSLTVVLYYLLLAWINRIYRNSSTSSL